MNKKILKLAIPNILSNITIPLLGLVDTALMGHQGKVSYMGAIALGSMIFNFIFWSFGFLRMGTVGFTAQAFGKNDNQEQILTLQRSVTIALGIGIFLILVHPLIIQFALSLTNSGSEVETFAKDYFSLRIWAAPASLIILVFTGWFIGMQNSVYPMIIAIFSNLINIALSSYLVLGLNLKVEGAALGSIISQYLTLSLVLFLFYKKYKSKVISFQAKLIFQSKALIDFAKVNSDIFIRTIGIILVFSYFTIDSANVSDTTLAVNSVLFQFFILFSYMLDGFANAAEAITGEQIGAKNISGLKHSIQVLFWWGSGFALLFSAIYWIFGNQILALLTDQQSVRDAAKTMFYWVIFIPIISFPAFMWDGVFIGATASAGMRNAMILAVFVFFILLVIPNQNPMTQMWLAFSGFMFSRGLFMTLFFKKSVLKKVL